MKHSTLGLLITLVIVAEATETHRRLHRQTTTTTNNHHTISRHQQEQGILQEHAINTHTHHDTPSYIQLAADPQQQQQPQPQPQPQQPSATNNNQPVINVQPASNGFLGLSERQFTILIICGCVAALIFVMLFFFRDKVRIIMGYIENGCYHFFKFLLMPFVCIRWLFRRITYPLKQGCFSCYEACYGYCHPASVKV